MSWSFRHGWYFPRRAKLAFLSNISKYHLESHVLMCVPRWTASPPYSLELLPEIRRTFQTIIFDALLDASWNANVFLKYLQHFCNVLRFASLIINIDSLYGLIMHKKFEVANGVSVISINKICKNIFRIQIKASNVARQSAFSIMDEKFLPI